MPIMDYTQPENKAEAGEMHKFAVITGASSGIGRSAAVYLGTAGYTVIVCARNNKKLAALVEEISMAGGQAHPMVCDVSDSGQVRKLAQEISGITNRLHLLFNNAGSGSALPLDETSDEIWSHTVGSVLSGTFYCTRELLPLLKAVPGSLIINNASVAAHRGFPNFAAYAAAKGGVVSFSRAIREELRSYSIRVTTLSAGATDTPFWDNVQGEWDRTRMMDCDTIGKLILQLVQFPECAQVEEILVMPAGGAL